MRSCVMFFFVFLHLTIHYLYLKSLHFAVYIVMLLQKTISRAVLWSTVLMTAGLLLSFQACEGICFQLLACYLFDNVHV